MMALSLGAAACGGGIDEETAEEDDNEQTAAGEEELSGAIRADGSSTVAPLTTAAAELFQDEHPKVRITVGTSGTGGGFEKFCNGETDISNASRPIKDEEAAACEKNGVEFEELQVANDGLSVVVNPENTWASCLTVEQLKKIWNDGSTVKTWKQVDPKFPAEPLELFGAGTDSGTFDYFTDAINGEEGVSRTDYNPSEDDNVTVEGVSGIKGAMGYFGLSYLQQNEGKIKGIEVDGGAGCVAATTDTVQSGEYTPLSRPLFIYVKKDLLDKPHGEAFAQFFIENTGEITKQALFVDLNADQKEEVLAKLASLTGGNTEAASKKPAGDLSGSIRADGSSTVAPLSTAAAELFQGEHPKVRITVGTSGTGGGFEKFCNGETDISNASRPIKDEEAAVCAENGVEFEEIQVANDGLSVVVNPANTWATCLTVEQLKKIWNDGSTVKTWKQVDPKFPAEPLELFGAGTDSGTFDYFTDAINGEEGVSRTDYNPSEDDNVTVEGVSGIKGAMGYFGLSYLEENEGKIKGVEVDGGAGCVAATTATVQSGEYTPLSRPLFMYVKKGLFDRPEGLAFVQYFIENSAEIADQALFVDLNAEQKKAVEAKLEELGGA
jgi:phosphate binding protein